MNLSSNGNFQPKESALVTGEFLLTVADFRKIASMLRADAGIFLPESKATLVYSRLAKRLRVLSLNNFQEYCDYVEGPQGQNERHVMLAALTTNVTRFFREPHHFEHLKTQVLPPLIDRARRGGKIRIWSAACSNGQEPYSIALTILSLIPDAVKFDIKILATDIDPNMVSEGERGVYSESLIEEVPFDLRKKWFQLHPMPGETERSFSVVDDLRKLVTFKELNLIGNWPMKGPFQAIFCRNVVIYFEQETQAKIWTRFVPLLASGGSLYIGHSERLSGNAADLFKSEGITTYRLENARRK